MKEMARQRYQGVREIGVWKNLLTQSINKSKIWQYQVRHTLQHMATYCNILQHTATYCNILQRTATYCNTQYRD